MLWLAGISIAASFHQAIHSNAQQGLKEQNTGQQHQLTEDLFVMTAAGGLIRHRLTLQQSMQQDADLLR